MSFWLLIVTARGFQVRIPGDCFFLKISQTGFSITLSKFILTSLHVQLCNALQSSLPPDQTLYQVVISWQISPSSPRHTASRLMIQLQNRLLTLSRRWPGANYTYEPPYARTKCTLGRMHDSPRFLSQIIKYCMRSDQRDHSCQSHPFRSFRHCSHGHPIPLGEKLNPQVAHPPGHCPETPGNLSYYLVHKLKPQ